MVKYNIFECILQKCFVKILQLKIQLVLVKVIDTNYFIFIPFKYILDDMLLIHEIIDWVKHFS
jgi:hypothetical protein